MIADRIALELDELNRHLADDALDPAHLRSSLTADGAVFEMTDGSTFFLHCGAAWRLNPTRNELTCWRAGRRAGPVRLAANWRDLVV